MRIAAEFGDVRLYPFERELLIHQAVIADIVPLAVERRMREEPEGAYAVIDRHENRIAFAGELAAVVVAGFARDQAATVDPHHDRSRSGFFSIVLRRIDVQVETVLGNARVGEFA